MGNAPPPARRPTPPSPARSHLIITIDDPADCYEAQVIVAREAFEANPGDTEVRFHVSGKRLLVPYRVHVGPGLLKGLRAAAGPSWTWDVVPVTPVKRTPPPVRRSA